MNQELLRSFVSAQINGPGIESFDITYRKTEIPSVDLRARARQAARNFLEIEADTKKVNTPPSEESIEAVYEQVLKELSSDEHLYRHRSDMRGDHVDYYRNGDLVATYAVRDLLDPSLREFYQYDHLSKFATIEKAGKLVWEYPRLCFFLNAYLREELLRSISTSDSKGKHETDGQRLKSIVEKGDWGNFRLTVRPGLENIDGGLDTTVFTFEKRAEKENSGVAFSKVVVEVLSEDMVTVVYCEQHLANGGYVKIKNSEFDFDESFGGFIPKRTRMETDLGNGVSLTEYEVLSFEANVDLDPTLFSFSPPDGFRIVDAESP